MAKNSFEDNRQFPRPLVKKGKGYRTALQERSQAILNTLQGILPSNYRATIPSTEYATHLKAMAIELGKFTLQLEDMATDVKFEDVRSEFLYQLVGYLVFVNGRFPVLGFSDEQFRCFLIEVIRIYFKGSTPEAISDAIQQFTDMPFELRENFLDARQEGSVYDISDQFGFRVSFEVSGAFPSTLFQDQANIDLLLNLVRPAHTLYRTSYLFREGGGTDGEGNPIIGEDNGIFNMTDEHRWEMSNYYYEEMRKNCAGLVGFSSTTGRIESLSKLMDTAEHPLRDVGLYTVLRVDSGENQGHYLVTGMGDNYIEVHPRFKTPDAAVAYEVEIDRLGKKKELLVKDEDASLQFQPFLRLQAQVKDSPLSVAQGTDVLLVGESNGTNVTYAWDLDQDQVYEVEGEEVLYTVPMTPGILTLYMLATTPDGQSVRTTAELQVT